jgi:hypothetical protein
MSREVLVRRTRFDFAIVVAVLVAVLLPAYSVSSPMTFERTYGSTGEDLGLTVQQTTDGGYIVTGASDDMSDTAAALLVKTDAHGDTLWTRRFGGTQRAAAGEGVQQTTDGGYVVVGNADSSGSGPGGVWLIKTDANGDTLWTRTYAGMDGALMVQQTADAGYLITGNSSYFGPDGADVLLIKTDSNGDLMWRRTWGGTGDDVGNCAQQTADGGYVIAANTMSFGAGSQDVWLIKTDSMGDTLWTRTFGGEFFEYAGSVQQTADGGYFVAGATTTLSDSPAVYLIKTDASGDTLWTRTFGGRGWTAGYSGGLTRDGGYVIVGFCGSGLPDVYLAKTDSNGDTLWTRSFGGSDLDMGFRVQQTADGGFVMVGETYSFGAGGADFYLIKTDENGNVAVAEPKASPSRKPVLLLTCAPNPFSGSTRISLSFQASDSRPLALRVYDAQGRLVRTFAASRKSCAVWDGRDDAGRLLPSGTYMVRFDAAREHATARIVLQH